MTSTIALIEWLDDKADDPAYFAHERQMFKAIVAKLSELTTLLERTSTLENERDYWKKRQADENEARIRLLERCEKAEAALAEALVGVETMSAWRTHFAEQLYAAERWRDEALKARAEDVAVMTDVLKFYDGLSHPHTNGEAALLDRVAARAAGGTNDKT